MAGMTRSEYKAADALSAAVSNRGFQPHGFLIRIQEFPSFVQREIWKLFMLWMKQMADDRNNTYSVWPDDLRNEAAIVWDSCREFYE